MKTVLLFSFVVSLELFINEAVSAFQIVQREGTTWVGLKPDQTVQVKGYEVTEKVDSSTLLRKDYIKRDTDKDAIMFYTHHPTREVLLVAGGGCFEIQLPNKRRLQCGAFFQPA